MRCICTNRQNFVDHIWLYLLLLSCVRVQLKCDGTRRRTEHVVSSITTADAHTSVANSRLN
jgi:hypothetical protein